MNTQDVVSTQTPVTAPDPTPVLLTPDAVLVQLMALRQQIPDFTQLQIPDAQTLRSAANVGPVFVQTAIETVRNSGPVQSALGQNPDDMQQEALAADQWSAVERELRSLLQGVSATNLVRRHKVGMTALQTYNISRQLVRGKAPQVDLIPRIAEMRRANRFGRKPKGSQTPGTPASQPTTPQSGPVAVTQGPTTPVQQPPSPPQTHS